MALNTIGSFGFGMPGRGSGGFNVTFQNAALVKRILNDIEDGMRSEANRELRGAAKEIARSLIPSIKAFAAMSPMPIARAMAYTARPKSDRLVMVQVGGVNPTLRGFKRNVGIKRATARTRTIMASGRQGTSRNYRTTLAWASEMGPYPGSAYNRFKVPRRPSGYYVQPAVNANVERAKREYAAALDKLIREKSRYR